MSETDEVASPLASGVGCGADGRSSSADASPGQIAEADGAAVMEAGASLDQFTTTRSSSRTNAAGLRILQPLNLQEAAPGGHQTDTTSEYRGESGSGPFSAVLWAVQGMP